MNVSIRKALAANTPASVMSDYSSDHISALMVQSGIKALEVSKYVSGFGSAISVNAEFFDDVPKAVKTLGYVRKDALGALMVSSNLIGITVSFEEAELTRTRKSWENAAKACEPPPVFQGTPEGTGTTTSAPEAQTPQETAPQA